MRASSNFSKAIHVCLLLNSSEEMKSSSQLAKHVDTNPVVIRRLLGLLRDADLVRSVAGPKGGFLLKRAAHELTLWDIYLAVKEEPLFARPKVNPECDISCNLEVLVHDAFVAAELSMRGELDHVTLADLSKDLEGLLQEQSPAL